ncbi:MAG: metallophosphoesterase [Alicyclobacillus sp.]|nr:metallophosphoesterase [Alicyclobacillus sp.]
MNLWLWIGVVLLAGAALCWALFILPTRWLKVERVCHSLGIGQRVLQLSDIHVEMLRVAPRRLRRVVETERPDYIFITGDFLDDLKAFPRLEPYLDEVQSGGVPVYAVLGNHDYKVRPVRGLVSCLQARGIQVLRNQCVHLDRFDLVGIDDFDTGMSDVAKAFRGVSADRPQVVITHDPNVVLHIRRPFACLMAGHLHGKQFNLPGLFRIRPMGPLPRMGVYQGLHRLEEGPVYISKGLGQVGINARFLVRSEVTVHEL